MTEKIVMQNLGELNSLKAWFRLQRRLVPGGGKNCVPQFESTRLTGSSCTEATPARLGPATPSSVLICIHSRGFSANGVMIDRMGSPFRYRKKERKRYRRHAKRDIVWAEKCEAEGIKEWASALSRRMAAFNLRMAYARRRKKTNGRD
jgi:hypothetical protein